ncbi:MAG: SufS family cysteine desulfurase [Gammaproteobacteria bacterium]
MAISVPAQSMREYIDLSDRRLDFPILAQQVHGKPLAYLDNAATTQKPRAVLDAIDRYYRKINANIHRGVHTLSIRATDAYESAREKIRGFINAGDACEVIFVRGTTEAINLVAQSYGRAQIRPGDEILISHMEHHSNIVPWQMLCEQTDARLKVIPVNEAGELDQMAFEKLLNPRTRLLALVHVSNALGTINPVRKLIAKAHALGAVVLIDGAQAVAHLAVDVQALDCDFYAFSAHKMFGPTGVGVLYGKRALLETMPPYQGGGDMIKAVRFEGTVYNDLPYRFEAGTPNIAGVIGLGAAVDYLAALGFEAIGRCEHELLTYATQRLSEVPGVRFIGTAREKASVLSFVLDGVHPHDVGTVLDHQGVAVRTGHHCAMPLMERFAVPATVRASFAFYNTLEEIKRLREGLHKAREVLL